MTLTHSPALTQPSCKPLLYPALPRARPCYRRWKTGRVTKPRFLVQNAEGDIPASPQDPTETREWIYFSTWAAPADEEFLAMPRIQRWWHQVNANREAHPGCGQVKTNSTKSRKVPRHQLSSGCTRGHWGGGRRLRRQAEDQVLTPEDPTPHSQVGGRGAGLASRPRRAPRSGVEGAGAAKDVGCWCLHCGTQRGAKKRLLQPGVLSLYYVHEHPLLISQSSGRCRLKPTH